MTGAGDHPDTTVIVTTYERPDALALVLRGLAAQAHDEHGAHGFEVIVADDGSGSATAEAVRRLRDETELGPRLRHVRHEDRGFRAAAIRNRAIARARGSWIVFLDGDCVPRPRLLARHRVERAPGCAVRGSRVLLSEALTEEVCRDQPPVHAWPLSRWWGLRAKGHVNRVLPLAAMPPRRGRPARSEGWDTFRTCHAGAWREDLLAIDGFDEAYEGWGHEDADLAARLINHGVAIKRLARGSSVLHLWHAGEDRAMEAKNRARLESVAASKRTAAERGIARADDDAEELPA